MGKFGFRIFGSFILALVLGSCRSSQRVSDQYQDLLEDHAQLTQAQATTIVFLIDGLATPILQEALHSGRATHLQKFFLKTSDRSFPLARASFPTLTFPNLVSILTATPITEHGVSGNRAWFEGKGVVNFEDPRSWDYLGDKIKAQTIFSKLREQHQVGISYSYPFSDVASISQHKNFVAAADYAAQDYAAVDRETLASLHLLLQNSAPEHWPRFLFVHLIGVDGYAHEFGPAASETRNYVNEVDQGLAPIFKDIESAEGKGHLVPTVLTADHGFVRIDHEVPVKALINEINSDVRVLEDNRVTSLRLPAYWSEARRRALVSQLARLPHLSWIVTKAGSALTLLEMQNHLQAHIDITASPCPSRPWAARFYWDKGTAATGFFCSENFDLGVTRDNISFLVPALVEYFNSVDAPDIVLVADTHSEFSGGYHGNHGGLTADEVLVPLLSHNTDLPRTVVPTSRLLNFLHLK